MDSSDEDDRLSDINSDDEAAFFSQIHHAPSSSQLPVAAAAAAGNGHAETNGVHEEFVGHVSGDGSDIEVLSDDGERPGLTMNLSGTEPGQNGHHGEEAKESGDNAWAAAEDVDDDRGMAGRYYNPGGMDDVQCYNCDKQGHLSRDCPRPKKRPPCHLCGGKDHMRRDCAQDLCHNCKAPGHQGRDCRRPRVFHREKCRRCSVMGHGAWMCPDLWRRYESVVDKEGVRLLGERKGGTDIKAELSSRAFCFACAADTHLGHECPQLGRPVAMPFVASFSGRFGPYGGGAREVRRGTMTEERPSYNGGRPEGRSKPSKYKRRPKPYEDLKKRGSKGRKKNKKRSKKPRAG